MSRAKKPPRHSRAELLILVKQQLERAGEQAISTDELLTALAPTGISRRTLERILSDLRTKHDANLSTSGKRRRWRLESPLPLPLDAPDPKDLIALRYAIAMAKPLLPLDLGDRLTTLDERLDERVRNYAASTDLPHHNALTSSSTHRMKTDARVVDQLLLACRRQTVRILYVSPWHDRTCLAIALDAIRNRYNPTRRTSSRRRTPAHRQCARGRGSPCPRGRARRTPRLARPGRFHIGGTRRTRIGSRGCT